MKIVLDLFYNYDDNIFNYDVAQNVIGGSWVSLIFAKAKQQGVSVVLANRYLSSGSFSSNDLIISEGVTAHTAKLLSTPAKPFILFSCESPNVDWKLYTFISRYTKPYKYALLFGGCEKYLHKSTKFIPLFWPNDSKIFHSHKALSFGKSTKQLVMIASNKKQNSIAGNNRIKAGIKSLGMKAITKLVPSVKSKDLYSLRMDAIKYFSDKQYFDLYGKNWNNHSNLTDAEKQAVVSLLPKEIDSKYEVLSQYKFALCFENCIYPGYITEKIFDCFLAKCIPIYLGAPDIEKFIPSNLFIDMRLFSNFDALDSFISNISEDEHFGYIKRMEEYINSVSFNKFTDMLFARTIMELAAQENAVLNN